MIEHRDIIRRLDKQQRHYLRQLSNMPAAMHLLGHVVMITLAASYIVWRLPLWPLMMLPLGILLIFLFTLLHESIHETAFRTRWINRVIGIFIGFLILLPPSWFRCFHMAHHRHTQDPENDPELATRKPESWQEYIRYLSGIPVWYSQLKTLTNLTAARQIDEFVPDRARNKVIRQARMMMAGYFALLILSVLSNSTILLWIWLVPLMLGQPFLRAYLLAEHGRCPCVSSMLDNTRTTLTNRIVRFLAWNMPYHTEHHCYPVVPFHKLPELHELMKHQLLHANKGYTEFHSRYVSQFGADRYR